MSQENVERLQAVYSEWAQGNFRPGGRLFAPDIAFDALTDGRAAIGRDAVEGYMREFLAQWTEFRIEAKDFVEVGETILVTERQHGTGKSSGVEVEMTVYAVWTFRDGVVVRVRWEIDRDDALEATGLSE
jgi:ketosteroid isomerase-like protein